MRGTDWPEVYDLVEAIHDSLAWREEKGKPHDGDGGPDQSAAEVNKSFRRRGIGWQLVDGRIEVRGPEVSESMRRKASAALRESGRDTAVTELHEALVYFSQASARHDRGDSACDRHARVPGARPDRTQGHSR